MHPDEGDRSTDEVQEDVCEAEHRRRVRNRLEGALDAALDVDPGGLLDRDDVGGVLHGSLDVLAAGAANDLVDAVQHREARDLASTGMGVGEPAAEHVSNLAPRRAPKRCGDPAGGGVENRTSTPGVAQPRRRPTGGTPDFRVAVV